MMDDSDMDSEIWEAPFLSNQETEDHKVQAAKNFKHLQKKYSYFVECVGELLSAGGSIQGQSAEYTHLETALNKIKHECENDDAKVYKLEQFIKTTEKELKTLRSENEEIQDDILQLSEELEKLSVMEEHLMKERKEATAEMEAKWNAYVQAKNIYKRKLEIHVRLHYSTEKPTGKIVSKDDNDVEIFTCSYLLDSKTLLAVKLSKQEDQWKMLEVDPFISAADDARTALHKTNDIRGFVFRLWKEALRLSNNVS